MDNERLAKLKEALAIAERVGNSFMAQNIRKAISELVNKET